MPKAEEDFRASRVAVPAVIRSGCLPISALSVVELLMHVIWSSTPSRHRTQLFPPSTREAGVGVWIEHRILYTP